MPAIFLLSGIFFINSSGTNNISPGQINDISRLFFIILALPVTPISPIDIPLSKNIAGIVTNQNVNDVYALFNKNNTKISTICNLENINNHKISNGDLIKLQLNEGVIYMGQIEDDDAIDKYKYV